MNAFITAAVIMSTIFGFMNDSTIQAIGLYLVICSLGIIVHTLSGGLTHE